MSASSGRRWRFINFLWAVSVAVCPTWIGRGYTRTDSDAWREIGVFGLADGDSVLSAAPVWSPPKPYSRAISTQLRWPTFPIAEDPAVPDTAAVIEVSWISSLIRLAAGWIVIGALFRIWSWRREVPLTGRATMCVWRMTQTLFVGLLSTFALGIASRGSLWSDGAVAGILGASLAMGLCWGIAAAPRTRPVAMRSGGSGP